MAFGGVVKFGGIVRILGSEAVTAVVRVEGWFLLGDKRIITAVVRVEGWFLLGDKRIITAVASGVGGFWLGAVILIVVCRRCLCGLNWVGAIISHVDSGRAWNRRFLGLSWRRLCMRWTFGFL